MEKRIRRVSKMLILLSLILQLGRVTTSSSPDTIEEKDGKQKQEQIRRRRIIIVKIGGSSITNKSKLESLDIPALDWFAKTISKYPENSHDNDNFNDSSDSITTQYIIVHGAGSFGHYQAKAFGFRGVNVIPENETKNEKKDISKQENNNSHSRAHENGIREGLAKTRLSVQKLNLVLLSILIQYNIDAVGISPFSLVSPLMKIVENSNNNNTFSHLLDPFQLLTSSIINALNQGVVPVLHGDAIFMSSNTVHAGILGGDDIVYAIASYFSQQREQHHQKHSSGIHDKFVTDDVKVVFITDVDGVFTSDPKFNPNAELIHLITVSPKTGKIVQVDNNTISNDSDTDNLHVKTVQASKSSHDHDVTGGLESKLRAAVHIAKQGVQVAIVKCQSESAVNAVHGKEFEIGTIIQMHSYHNDQDQCHD